MPVQGTKMFVVLRKLKRVKDTLKELNKNGFSHLQATEVQAHQRIIESHPEIHQNPGDSSLKEAELQVEQEYKNNHNIYVEF